MKIAKEQWECSVLRPWYKTVISVKNRSTILSGTLHEGVLFDLFPAEYAEMQKVNIF